MRSLLFVFETLSLNVREDQPRYSILALCVCLFFLPLEVIVVVVVVFKPVSLMKTT